MAKCHPTTKWNVEIEMQKSLAKRRIGLLYCHLVGNVHDEHAEEPSAPFLNSAATLLAAKWPRNSSIPHGGADV